MPEERMYQVVMQMNVLSPEMFNVTEVDAIHLSGRQYHYNRNRQGDSESVGVLGNDMIQNGKDVNLGEPLNSSSIKMEYVGTSQNRRGLTDDLMVVGLIGSTPSVGEPRTWGSGQRWRNSFSTCLTDALRSG